MTSEINQDSLTELLKENEALRTTMRQQAERLHFVEQALATVSSPITIADMRQPDYPLIFINHAFEQLTGYAEAEIIGRNCRFLQNDDRDQAGIAEMNRALKAGQPCTVIVRNYQKDGSLFWNEVSLSPIYDKDGALTHFVGIQNNISGHKIAEENLQNTKGQLQAILDNSVAAIFIKDLSGCYIMANRRYYELNGIKAMGSIEGKDDFDIFPPERAKAFYAADQQVMLENHEVEIEETFIRGEQKFTHLTVKFPLRDSYGHPYAIGAIATDITERKRYETELQEALDQQRELTDLKVRFVSMASHEFRTPLAAILAASETLIAYRHKMSDEDTNRRLQKIENQVKHLRGIIDDVLQLTRNQSEPATAAFSEFDFDGLCREMVEEFQNQPDVTQHFVYTASEQPFRVYLDPQLMRQILTNLISNTIKYSAKDKTVWVDIARRENEIILKVRDEGIGIPADDMKHLFEAFHRASNVGTVQGTGLGLAITLQAVERQGGKMDVQSEVGVGTTIIVSLPQGM